MVRKTEFYPKAHEFFTEHDASEMNSDLSELRVQYEGQLKDLRKKVSNLETGIEQERLRLDSGDTRNERTAAYATKATELEHEVDKEFGEHAVAMHEVAHGTVRTLSLSQKDHDTIRTQIVDGSYVSDQEGNGEEQ